MVYNFFILLKIVLAIYQRGDVMNKKLIFIFFTVTLLLCSSPGFAETKSITLPKGTTVEKVEAGYFKIKLPDGQMVEVKNFESQVNILEGGYKILVGDSGKRGIIGDCGIYDRSGKLTGSGIKPIIKSGAKPAAGTAKLSAKDLIKFDETVVYLPATMLFVSEESKNIMQPNPRLNPESKK